MICNACPRQCGVDRSKKIGFCGTGESFAVARAAKHFWEEPPIRGSSSFLMARAKGDCAGTGCLLQSGHKRKGDA